LERLRLSFRTIEAEDDGSMTSVQCGAIVKVPMILRAAAPSRLQ
jgi:hypothetical protein